MDAGSGGQGWREDGNGSGVATSIASALTTVVPTRVTRGRMTGGATRAGPHLAVTPGIAAKWCGGGLEAEAEEDQDEMRV